MCIIPLIPPATSTVTSQYIVTVGKFTWITSELKIIIFVFV